MSYFDDLSREELIAVIHELQASVEELSERVAYLEKENEALRGQLPGGGASGAHAPPFVKPNKKERSDAPRKKRKKWFVRRRETPTEEIPHSTGERCPDCGGPLSTPWEHRRHQVIEVPETPIRVIDHIIMAQRCGYCRKVHYGKLTPADGVIGNHRFGIGFMSLVATLCTVSRIPQRMIPTVVEGLYGVQVSIGEISEILHKVAKCGKAEAGKILEEIRTSRVAHGDETGWREDGVNGYIWSFSTPEARYIHRDGSRGQKVAKEILGETFCGVLVADFYAGYNWYTGPIQRCWAHMKRDLELLKEKHEGEAGVEEFVHSIMSLYSVAKKIARRLNRSKAGERERSLVASGLEEKLYEIAKPYMDEKDAPQHTLAKRIRGHGGEFFTFVRYEGVPSTNNAAERAIRPAVTARKISGGTRSGKGSETRSVLMTLFGTWTLRKLAPLDECERMLKGTCLARARAPT